MGGKRFQFGNIFVNRVKGLFLSVHTDDVKLAGKKQKTIRRGKYQGKTLIWENQHHSLTMLKWVALRENVR